MSFITVRLDPHQTHLLEYMETSVSSYDRKIAEVFAAARDAEADNSDGTAYALSSHTIAGLRASVLRERELFNALPEDAKDAVFALIASAQQKGVH